MEGFEQHRQKEDSQHQQQQQLRLPEETNSNRTSSVVAIYEIKPHLNLQSTESFCSGDSSPSGISSSLSTGGDLVSDGPDILPNNHKKTRSLIRSIKILLQISIRSNLKQRNESSYEVNLHYNTNAKDRDEQSYELIRSPKKTEVHCVPKSISTDCKRYIDQTSELRSGDTARKKTMYEGP